MLLQRLDKVLSVCLPCAATDALGDVVELLGDNLVGKLENTASKAIVGEIVKKVTAGQYGWDSAEEAASIETPFTMHRDDRVSGAACVAGPFVYNAAGKVINYAGAAAAKATGTVAEPYELVVSTNDKIVVTGTTGGAQTVTLTAGAARTAQSIVDELNGVATHTGSATGVKTVVLDNNDKLKVTMGSDVAQTITLAPGVGRTMASIAAEINLVANGFVASVDGSDHLVLTANARPLGTPQKNMIIGTVTHDCYTLLGLTAATYAPKLVSGSCYARVIDISGDPGIELVNYALAGNLTIGTTATDCHAALGLTEQANTPTAATHDAAAIAGLVLVGVGGADLAVETLEY